ncbi:NAD(P)/FAD-dependent oxidoreductase [Niallia endozanthoxylica]|uniref:NAD(P)/FAD-dependent oxidoreductase n=1 Tax=Niallia endozanthoxylica TaxID=2036016 RepID=A0A5J5H1U5_9BACI|nr:NAD(P)/FAD-dependent oxidoreductase [Niallia endozanthoxylica]KAA9014491.1 NAD(P)/FAD-dependent oxidoreductase [Niallia endozanthoxylica]
MKYDCIIVGGGIAGLQAAIQLGRYMHQVLVIDSSDGRSTICRSYHNILGYPDGVSGQHLRDTGRRQAEALGIHFLQGKAESAAKTESGFEVTVSNGDTYRSKRLLLATGVMDRIPADLLPSLMPCLGVSIYVCPDCDGYQVKGKCTIVIGSGVTGVEMVKTLSYWTKDLVYINHEQKSISDEDREFFYEKKILYIETPIEKVITDESQLQGFLLENGEEVLGNYAFTAFGGNEVRSQLAKQLGVELLENKHIVCDPRTKMTNIHGVWAAGDIAAHSEQVTIAMGEGSQAAIWIHKDIIQGEG